MVIAEVLTLLIYAASMALLPQYFGTIFDVSNKPDITVNYLLISLHLLPSHLLSR